MGGYTKAKRLDNKADNSGMSLDYKGDQGLKLLARIIARDLLNRNHKVQAEAKILRNSELEE